MAASALEPPVLSIYLVFNPFEKIPPSSDSQAFREGWLQTAKNVAKNECFLVTHLHRNIDPEGKYKYINHAAFDGPDFALFRGPSKDKQPSEPGAKGQGHPHIKCYPGGYEELCTSSGKPLAPWIQRDNNSVWILTGFSVDTDKTAELSDFEKDWLANSGAEFILNDAPKELGILKVGFYKKFTPRPALDYFLRAEITGIKDDNMAPAVEFLKKLREFKYPACVIESDSGLYKTDPENILYSEEGKRPPPEGHFWIPE